jgi:hypothetical protein
MPTALPRYVQCPILPLATRRTSTDRANSIMVAAYYKALRKDFEPGHALDDWLEAEREVTLMFRARY